MPHPAVIRRVHLPDAQAMHAFWLRLSGTARRSRFHGAVNDVSPAFLRDLVTADGQGHAAWVACIWGPHGEEIVGEAVWYIVDAEQASAEFGISVRDDWQGRGLADDLMRTLLQAARQAQLLQVYGDVLRSNARMLAFVKRHGMSDLAADPPPEPGVLRMDCTFDGPRPDPRRRVRQPWLERLTSRWA